MARTDIEKLRQWLPVQNTEVTDPGITVAKQDTKDEYIAPRPQQSLWPARWIQSLISRKKVREEAAEIIAKIERLSQAPDTAIRYFFKNDLPKLVHLSNVQPLVVQQMLREHETKGPWFRLVQIACADSSAILPALDELC